MKSKLNKNDKLKYHDGRVWENGEVPWVMFLPNPSLFIVRHPTV